MTPWPPESKHFGRRFGSFGRLGPWSGFLSSRRFGLCCRQATGVLVFGLGFSVAAQSPEYAREGIIGGNARFERDRASVGSYSLNQLLFSSMVQGQIGVGFALVRIELDGSLVGA